MCYYCKPGGSCVKDYLHATRTEALRTMQPSQEFFSFCDDEGLPLPSGMVSFEESEAGRKLEAALTRNQIAITDALQQLRSLRSHWGSGSCSE